MKICLTALLVCILSCSASGQSKSIWDGKKCAVVLTYDDALQVHLDNVVPALDSLGFKGTFYVTGNFPGFTKRLTDWKKAAQHGHELGNHTMFHPCLGGTTGREWVKPDYDMTRYSVKRMQDEIISMNTLLTAMDGRTTRTFAYPCGDARIGDVPYLQAIGGEFTAARGVKAEMLPVDEINLYNVGAYGINGESGKQMIALVQQALQKKTLIVFLFHGVGGEHNLNVSLPAHRELLKFLKENEKEIWITTFADATKVIATGRK